MIEREKLSGKQAARHFEALENKPEAPANNEKKGADGMTKTAELALKKQTLEAWARILYGQGMIDLARCNRMIEAIGRLKA